jgi:hypothetical protein
MRGVKSRVETGRLLIEAKADPDFHAWYDMANNDQRS